MSVMAIMFPHSQKSRRTNNELSIVQPEFQAAQSAYSINKCLTEMIAEPVTSRLSNNFNISFFGLASI